jgi:hypothetical protein
MISRSGILSLILIAGTCISSCKKETEDPVDLGLDYAPQTIGSYIIYDVTEIRIDQPVNYYDTAVYQLKEKIHSQFIDNVGRPSLRIERYWRTSDTLPWVIKDVWYSTRTNFSYEKTEENQRFIKLQFPVKNTQEWDGNSLNPLSEWEYSYEWIDDPFTLGTNSFDKTIKVLQRDNFNFVEYEQAFEIYAHNIGLISRQLIDLDINNGNINDVQKGSKLFQTMISYGVE